MSGHYMSFAATATLRLDAETFISNIHSGDKLPQTRLLQRVLDGFINQCLHCFFMAPMEVVGLSPIGRRIMVTAVATIRKTVQLVMSRIIRKLSNRDMQPLAQFIDELMLRDPGDPDGLAFIAFPLDEKLGCEFHRLRQRAHQDPCDQVVPELVASFQSMADTAISRLFSEPLATLKLGPVVGKMTQLGIDSTRSVTGTMIRRIFSTMNQQQVAATLDYFCAMISASAPLVTTGLSRLERA